MNFVLLFIYVHLWIELKPFTCVKGAENNVLFHFLQNRIFQRKELFLTLNHLIARSNLSYFYILLSNIVVCFALHYDYPMHLWTMHDLSTLVIKQSFGCTVKCRLSELRNSSRKWFLRIHTEPTCLLLESN